MGYIGMSGVFEEKSGVCKPLNSSTLGQYKAMQYQLNRVAAALSLSKIAVDGDIGAGTLRLLSNISAKLYNSSNPNELALANAASNQCSDVAVDAVNITWWAQWTADARGGGGSTPKPPSGGGGGQTTPPIVAGSGPGAGAGSGMTAGIWDKFKTLGTVEKAAVGVGLLAAGVWAGLIPLGKKRRKAGGRS